MRTLVLAEKEQAGEMIANYLNCSSASNGFWLSDKYIVVAERGHLLNMVLSKMRGVSFGELPITKVCYKISKEAKPKVDLIYRLYKEGCDKVIVATDFDREGEVIGAKMVDYIFFKNDALSKIICTDPKKISRIYFSALTHSELERAFDNEITMSEALLTKGIARNFADCVVGLNLTKALTYIFKINFEKLYQAVSMGRVQSPLLSAIVSSTGIKYEDKAHSNERQTNITMYYVETPYGDIWLKGINDIEADEIEITSFEEEEYDIEQAENFPDTFTVQSELPISPENSMNILEALYLKGFATYPRTHSHYIPEEVAVELENKMKEYSFMSENFSADNCLAVEEEKDLPHWAITLTVEGIDALAENRIKGREEIVAKYLLIKMIRAMAPELHVTKTIAKILVDNQEKEIVWSEECSNIEESIKEYREFIKRPEIDVGVYKIKKIWTNETNVNVSSSDNAFKPQINVFDDKTLVEWMTNSGLGTEATRHTFPMILRKRNYTDAENLPNQFGNIVGNIIQKIGLNTNLTANMENKIESLTSLSEFPAFGNWVISVTKDLLTKLSQTDAKIIDSFECPKQHRAYIISTRKGVCLRCDECGKFYSL